MPDYTTIDLDVNIFDPQPMWLPLFDVLDSPGIHLTPLDWSQMDFAERISTIAGTTVLNVRTLLRQLISLSKADDWRGFVRQGEPIPFDAETLWKVLCSNKILAEAFNSRLVKMALTAKQFDEASRKNFSAGDGTPSIAPATAKKRGPHTA